MTDCIVVLITVPQEEEAAKMANTLIDERLAACVNILKDIRSLYRWKGAIEDEGEVLMVVKTQERLFENLAKRVKQMHSYSVPEIIALPIVKGSDNYIQWLKWLKDETE
jgi:periplasmic divalent cation tolerance protein